MLGMVKSTNAIPNVKHCNDNPTQLKEMLLEAKEKYDLIITTGGTAVSESDIVVDTVDEIGKVFSMALQYNQEKPWHLEKLMVHLFSCFQDIQWLQWYNLIFL